MSIDLGKIIGTAFRYAFSVNRILPYFIINLFIFVGIIILLTSAVNIIPIMMQTGTPTMMYAGQFIASVLLFIIAIVIISLVKILVDSAVADNSRQFWAGKDRFLSSSYDIAKKKYLSVLGAVLIVGIITILISMIPFVGWLISMILGIMFMFVIQSVIIGGKNATKSLSDSYNVFKKNVLNTLIFWILMFIIIITFFILAIIPVMIAAIPAVMAFVASGGNFMSIIPLLQQNMNWIIIGGVIGCAILAYIEVFSQSAMSFFYISAKKKGRS